MTGALWEDLPNLKGVRGLILMTCGYILGRPDRQEVLATLVAK